MINHVDRKERVWGSPSGLNGMERPIGTGQLFKLWRPNGSSITFALWPSRISLFEGVRASQSFSRYCETHIKADSSVHFDAAQLKLTEALSVLNSDDRRDTSHGNGLIARALGLQASSSSIDHQIRAYEACSGDRLYVGLRTASVGDPKRQVVFRKTLARAGNRRIILLRQMRR